MNEIPSLPLVAKAPYPAWFRSLHSAENYLLAFVLAAIMLLPLLEVVLRKLGHVGIAGSSAFVQHFTLLVGVLGGAMAARESRLLTLSSLPHYLKGRLKAGSIR